MERALYYVLTKSARPVARDQAREQMNCLFNVPQKPQKKNLHSLLFRLIIRRFVLDTPLTNFCGELLGTIV